MSLVKTRRTWELIIRLDVYGYEPMDFHEAEAVADAATRAVVGDDPFWPGLYRGCIEWQQALLGHLQQWDYGEPGEVEATSPVRSWQDAADWPPYLLCWDAGYAAALYRVTDTEI